MNKVSSERAIKNARSSVEMEGLLVDSEMEKLCARILDGKYSLKEYLNEYKNKKEQKSKTGEKSVNAVQSLPDI